MPTLGTTAYTGSSNLDYGQRWAEVSATPFRLWKSFPAEGGHSVPTIVKLPGAVPSAQSPQLNAFTHVVDLAPTFLELAGIAAPSTPAAPLYDAKGVNRNAGKVVYDGRNVYPITGLSLVAARCRARPRRRARAPPSPRSLYGRTYVYSDNWEGHVDRAAVRPGPWRVDAVRHPRGPWRDQRPRRPASGRTGRP